MKSVRKINVAIDGYSGTGKSSTAKEVAKRMGYTYLDTGAMYRAVTYGLIEDQVAFNDRDALDAYLAELDIDFYYNAEGACWNTLLNGIDVSDEIRKPAVSSKVSEVSTLKEVREKLVALQKEIAARKGIVMDGRDIGTVVLPKAELKIFMMADLDVRVKRRIAELKEAGIESDELTVRENLAKRDHIDSTRKESPLKKAKDAVELDTTFMDFEDQVTKILDMAAVRRDVNIS